MDFSRRTAQLLHEDHQATVEIIEALDAMIGRAKRSIPDISDATVRKALEMAATAIEDEISEHFNFEETELFTRLEDFGDVEISEHLREEHAVLLPLGKQVSDLAKSALENGFSDTQWATFRPLAGELIERMLSHIQKEEMALLPMLEDLLDPETDMELSVNYANIHENQ